MTNALLHGSPAGSPLTAALTRHSGTLLLSVHKQQPSPAPAPRHVGPGAGGGRGLAPVAQLADARGHQCSADGKPVSAAFTLTRHATPVPHCACRPPR